MTKQFSDAIVIGGGLHGLSSALHLARSGLSATLLEQSYIGHHSSDGSVGGVRTLNMAFEELPIAFEAMDMWNNMERFFIGSIENGHHFRDTLLNWRYAT